MLNRMCATVLLIFEAKITDLIGKVINSSSRVQVIYQTAESKTDTWNYSTYIWSYCSLWTLLVPIVTARSERGEGARLAASGGGHVPASQYRWHAHPRPDVVHGLQRTVRQPDARQRIAHLGRGLAQSAGSLEERRPTERRQAAHCEFFSLGLLPFSLPNTVAFGLRYVYNCLFSAVGLVSEH